MRRVVVIILLLGLVLGVAVGPVLLISNWLVFIWLLLACLAVILVIYKYNLYLVLILLFIVTLVMGIFRFNLNTLKSNNDVSNFAGQEVTLEGIIADDPQVENELIKFSIAVRTVDNRDSVGKVLISTRKFPMYYYGNFVKVRGNLKIPQKSKDFDYSKYLSRFGIYSTMDYPKIELAKPFEGNWFLSLLYKIKHYLINVINYILPEPAAAFLAGLLFGIRSNMPEELLDDFNIAGLTHIIALSGFNITIIAGALMNWLKYFPNKFRFILILFAIVSFVLLTGASPSVTRAAIMGMIILWAGIAGRLHDVTVSLLLAAAIMVLWNPKILIYDLGFQLSFLSTVGIIYLSPILDIFIAKKLGRINEFVSPTFSAIIFVLPIIAYNFGRISLVAPIANLFVLPFIPMTMALGFVAIILGLFSNLLGITIGLLAWVPMKLMISITEFIADFPFASISVNINHFVWVFAYYIILIILLIYGHKFKQKISLHHSCSYIV